MQRFCAQNKVNITVLLFLGIHTLLMGRFWPWNIFSVIPSVCFTVLPIVLALWNVYTKNMRGFLVIAACLPFVWWNGDIALPLHTHQQETGTLVTVFNWNTEFWETDQRAEMFELLQKQDADIYQLQERMDTDEGPYDDTAEMRRAFPNHSIVEEGELVTLSTFPIVYTATGSNFLRTDVDINGTHMRFYNVHIRPPFMPGNVQRPLYFLIDLRHRFLQRHIDLQALQQDIAGSPLPYYISGDFNTTGSMGSLRGIAAHAQDSARASAQLFPRSWMFHGFTLWRLDYNFLSAPLRVLTHENIWAPEFSDHAGQVVRFLL